MSFLIRGIDPRPFRELFSLGDDALKSRGMRRRRADEVPGFPCRVSLEDAAVGEEVLLVNHVHHDVQSPYRGSGPIYVRRLSERPAEFVDAVPLALARRLLS